jgi:hypothetical protein
MIQKYIALLSATLLSGLLWDCGSDLGLVFNLAVRPIALAILVVVFWATHPFRTKFFLLFAALLLSNTITNLVYALQTNPWHVTSDAETQLWIVISFSIQMGVAMTVLLVSEIIKKQRKPNHVLNRTVDPAGSTSG